MKKINVALIGFGMSGKDINGPQIVNNINYDLKMIMTRNPKKQEEVKRLHPNVKIITKYEDAINDPLIDLIVIATSNDVHYDYTKLALLNNKHVVCEKPFVETYKEAKELFDLANSKQLILKVFHNLKYTGEMKTIKDLLTKKDFGKLLSFESRFDRLEPLESLNWRFKKTLMGGVFYDLAPHVIHNAIDLFGMPNKVFNTMFYNREGLNDDSFEMFLYYDNDFHIKLGSYMFERFLLPKVSLIGTKGTYVKYGYDSTNKININDTRIYDSSDHLISYFIDNNLKKENIPVYLGDTYLFYENLKDDILNKKENKEDTNLSLGVILIMEMALKSHHEKRIINIPKF